MSPAKAQPAPTGESAAAQAQRARLTRGKSPNPAALTPIPTVADATAPAHNAGGAVERIHIKACIASPLNPRKTFPEEQIRELADSIAENGLLQPLTGRVATDYLENIPSAREIFIGGRRLRALELLYAEGRWPHEKLPGGHLVPVIRRDVDDLELLTIAVAENVNRADMHPLEEGQAFHELHKRGRSLDEIAQAYGKTRRWVEQRIQVATGLDEKSKTLFAAGEFTMETARVLVRLPETERKGVVTAIAKKDPGYQNAAAIKARIAEGLPKVSTALFDLSLYKGEYETAGPAHSHSKRFADIEQFRTLQNAAIEAKRAELAKEWAFVEVLRVKNEYYSASEHGFDRMWEAADPTQHGALIGVTADLVVRVLEGVCRGNAPPQPTKADLKAAGDPVVSIGAGRREFAHQAKSCVLQTAVHRAGHRAALEVAIMAMLGDGSMVGLRTDAPPFDARAVDPALITRMEGWRKRLGMSPFKVIDPASRNATSWLEFDSHTKGKQAGVYELLGELSDDETRDLFDTLVAARVVSMCCYGSDGPSLGDQPLAIVAAKRYGADMAKDWRIDADYLAKLQADDLHVLAARLNVWVGVHQPTNGDTIQLSELQRLKVVDRRATILDFVVANDVRYVPPEMEIKDAKAIEKALRVGSHPKAAEPQQLDLVEAINATKNKPATATLRWANAAAEHHKSLLASIEAALPRHPDFGKSEIWISANGGRLLLDAAMKTPGTYYIIGTEGSFGRSSPDEIAAILCAWLASVATAQPPAPPVDQAAEADDVDATIDALFSDLPAEESEEDLGEIDPPTIAFVRSPHCALPVELLDSLSDALPRHHAYGNETLRIDAADATITLTVETLDGDEDAADPDTYIITGYLDDTLLRDKEPLPVGRVVEVITAWLASLTNAARPAEIAA